QQPRHDRQGELFHERRRLSDAGQEGPAAAGPALLQHTGKLSPPRADGIGRNLVREVQMAFNKRLIGAVVFLALLALPVPEAAAHDESKYPDWSGQWRRPRGLATQWDQDKPAGLGQEAPLKPEYLEKLKWSIADQAAGGQGLDTRYTCITNGMPRMMAVI